MQASDSVLVTDCLAQKAIKIMPQNSPKTPRGKLKSVLHIILTGLPLSGIVVTSLFPGPAWIRQALVLVTLIWFYAFFLLDTFFLGG